jgi:hypothetical protein
MRRLAPLSALGGVALLVSLFLPWFDPAAGEYGWFSYVPLDGSAAAVEEPPANPPEPVFSLTGWEAFSALDVLLALFALLAIAGLLLRGATRLSALTGWIAVAIVGARLIHPIPGLTPDYGAWIGFGGALVAWLAACGRPARPHLGRLRRAEPLAGLGGLVLLVSLSLPWYGFEPFPAALPDEAPGYASVSAWQALELTSALLMVLALLALTVPATSLLARGPAPPIAAAVVASAIGWIAIAAVIYALVETPEEWPELRYGAWVSFAGAVLAWVGSWLSLRDESTPGATAPDVPRRPAPG